MKPLFIIGCPRSGTTLVQQILVRHPAVVIPPETAFFTELLSPWPGRFRRQLERIEADLGISLGRRRRPRNDDQIGALYRELAAAYAARAGRPEALWFGDKTPDHLRPARRIAELLPSARFVLVQRDGRDVALSLARVPWAPSDPVVNFGLWLEAARRQLDLQAVPPAPLLVLRYEDLVRAPETEVRRLTGFLDLDFQDRLLEPGAPARGVPEWERAWKAGAHLAIREDRVGVWKSELTEGQIGRMQRWGGALLEELGYQLAGPPARSGGPGLATRVRRAAWRARVLAGLLAGRGRPGRPRT